MGNNIGKVTFFGVTEGQILFICNKTDHVKY